MFNPASCRLKSQTSASVVVPSVCELMVFFRACTFRFRFPDFPSHFLLPCFASPNLQSRPFRFAETSLLPIVILQVFPQHNSSCPPTAEPCLLTSSPLARGYTQEETIHSCCKVMRGTAKIVASITNSKLNQNEVGDHP